MKMLSAGARMGFLTLLDELRQLVFNYGFLEVHNNFRKV
jgi:hypothetical protein